MQPGSHPSSYSLSADLMSRLKLDQPVANGYSEGPGTPDSMVAMGSVQSTTLSDFSAVGAPGGSSGTPGAPVQREGSGNRRPRHVGRSSLGSNRYLFCQLYILIATASCQEKILFLVPDQVVMAHVV